MEKETFLVDFNRQWQTLTQILEGVPFEVMENATLTDGKSIKEVCCLLTAWDGEALRRLRFVTGETATPPHNPDDTTYWQTWAKKQVQIKYIMPMQGIMVDMVATRQRLLSALADLNDFYFQRWLAENPQLTAPYYYDYLQKMQTWRATWNDTQPPENLLARVWHKIKQKLVS